MTRQRCRQQNGYSFNNFEFSLILLFDFFRSLFSIAKSFQIDPPSKSSKRYFFSSFIYHASSLGQSKVFCPICVLFQNGSCVVVGFGHSSQNRSLRYIFYDHWYYTLFSSYIILCYQSKHLLSFPFRSGQYYFYIYIKYPSNVILKKLDKLI